MLGTQAPSLPLPSPPHPKLCSTAPHGIPYVLTPFSLNWHCSVMTKYGGWQMNWLLARFKTTHSFSWRGRGGGCCHTHDRTRQPYVVLQTWHSCGSMLTYLTVLALEVQSQWDFQMSDDNLFLNSNGLSCQCWHTNALTHESSNHKLVLQPQHSITYKM